MLFDPSATPAYAAGKLANRAGFVDTGPRPQAKLGAYSAWHRRLQPSLSSLLPSSYTFIARRLQPLNRSYFKTALRFLRDVAVERRKSQGERSDVAI